MLAAELPRLGLQPRIPVGFEPHGVLANMMHTPIEKPLIDPSIAPYVALALAIGPALTIAALMWRSQDKRAKRENRPPEY